MNNKKIGYLGEKIAERYLKRKGYQILDKNFIFQIPGSPQKGEIDIITKRGDTFYFVEVKTSKISKNMIEPEERVNFQKKQRLARTAESWLIKNKISLDSKWQIDVVSVKVNLIRKRAKIKHFKNI
ncbi:YraN family protein [bacterium]|nr:YraN family protein [bacterium]